MCRLAIMIFLLGLAFRSSPAQTNQSSPIPPQTTFDYRSAAASQASALHDAWAAERNPVKRRDLAEQLVQAVIHDYDKQQTEIVDEVARDGALKNEIQSPLPAREVKLDPLTMLAGVHVNSEDYPPTPVFRRMTLTRFEAWTSKEGWLFDATGKVRADVKVPRRDGTGQEWFGAFLPDGTWITTDLWSNDEQLNCFSSFGNGSGNCREADREPVTQAQNKSGRLERTHCTGDWLGPRRQRREPLVGLSWL